jgi:isopenicillin N synthase-like dioxygenase
MQIGKEFNIPGHCPNKWPQEPEFKRAMLEFYDSCFNLHLKLMDVIGTGLGLNGGFFNQFCGNSDCILRLLHYPKVKKSILDRDGQTRAGYLCLTQGAFGLWDDHLAVSR